MKAISATLFTAVATVSLAFPTYAGAQESTNDYLFYDSFESGDMSATNDDGFRWTDGRRRSLVTSTHRIWSASGTTYDPIPEGANWDPHPEGGTVSLRFNYNSEQPHAEQRFELGASYPELWFRFWLKVPDNYTHGNPSGSSSNNKLFSLWTTEYSASGHPTFIAGLWRNSSTNSTRLTLGGSDSNGHAGDIEADELFISVPRDRGRWMQIVINIKESSNQSSSDGVVRIWRRWEDQDSFNLLAERSDLNYNGEWRAGYLMGWANSGFSEQTEFLLGDFVIDTKPLNNLDDYQARPNPPEGLKIERN